VRFPGTPGVCKLYLRGPRFEYILRVYFYAVITVLSFLLVFFFHTGVRNMTEKLYLLSIF